MGQIGCSAFLVSSILVFTTASQSSGGLDPQDFAIMPWGHTPGDPEKLREIKECGFNLAGFVSADDLDLVSEVGLEAIVIDGSIHVQSDLDEQEIKTRAKALVDRVGDHPALFGYYLRDEPGADLYSTLGKWVRAFREFSPQKLAYINLFPNYASPAQMNLSTYEEYVRRYIEVVKPDFISYDHYALMDDGSLRHGYFQNLEVIRAESLRNGLPFWNIVLSNAHFRYAEPTPAGLRFQVYTTLAYGARGISYFTYFAPPIGNYRLAPIDQFGHKTPTWDMLRNVNLQIHKLAPVYVVLKSINVFHHPNVPDGCLGIDTSRWLSRVEGGDLLVGEFQAPDGAPFVIVVNKSLTESVAFTVSFKDEGQIRRVNSYTGRIEPWRGENNWLAPGQGMMLTLSR